MESDFFYAGEEETFSFIRIPKALFDNPLYSDLPNDARILYGMILDRMSLSRKNGWADELGRIYVLFAMKAVEQEISVGHTKASQLLDLLEKHGLILRVRQGMGRPSRIYPRKFETADCRIPDLKKSDKRISECSENGIHEVQIPVSSNTELNDTERIESYRSDLEGMRSESADSGLLRRIDRQCSFSALIQDMPECREEILEIRDLIIDICQCREQTIRICGGQKSAALVKSRFRKLTSEHIRYVLQSLSENATSVKNIKQYLLAALYNAPLTMAHYYRAKVNHDLYG